MATTMTRNAFLKLLTRHLYPVLRIRGPVVHVFNVQGASGEGLLPEPGRALRFPAV